MTRTQDGARRLVLVRHAQASLGSADYDRLSERGHRQAECLARRLNGAVNDSARVHGSLRRHRQTAHALFGPLGREDRDLDEYHVDPLMRAAVERADELGLRLPPADAFSHPVRYLDTFLELFPSVLQAWQDDHLQCAVNGRWQAFSSRVAAAGNRLTDALDDQPQVIAVSSAGVISTLAAQLLGRDLAWQRRFNVSIYNASVTELERDAAGCWQLLRINCVAHLGGRELVTLA